MLGTDISLDMIKLVRLVIPIPVGAKVGEEPEDP
jgi:hypothetical protein